MTASNSMEGRNASIQEFWSSQVAPASGRDPHAVLEPIPEGYSTEVHRVKTDAGEFILRLYPERSRARMEGYLSANRVFSRLGIRVPHIENWKFGSGRHWLLEERIAGEGFGEWVHDREALGLAAETLAVIHSHTRDRYGDYKGWGGFRLLLRWRQRFPERWAKVTRLFPELREATEPVGEWFREWTESTSIDRYNLLHNDYHPGNLILTPEKSVAVLDLRSPRFGLGLLELVEACHHFLGEELSEWGGFTDPYLSSRGEAKRTDFERSEAGLHAVFHLRHADRFAGLALGNRGKIEDRRRWERNAFDSWLRFCDITGIVSPIHGLPRESSFRSSQSVT